MPHLKIGMSSPHNGSHTLIIRSSLRTRGQFLH